MWNINFRISSTLIKSVYDPSPVGLMVPPNTAFPIPTSYNFVGGYWFDTAAGPNTAFFPVTHRRLYASGGRSNPNEWPEGGYGALWSSTGNTYYEQIGQYSGRWHREAGALIFHSQIPNADKQQYRGRAYGFGVRSIREQ